MSKDKNDNGKGNSIRNSNLIGAGQKFNFPKDENGKQHSFAKTVREQEQTQKR